MIERIQWLGQGSFVLQGPPLIYINPVRAAGNAFLADVILISQASYENCIPQVVQRLSSDHTLVVANTEDECLDDVAVKVLRPWHSLIVQRPRISTLSSHPTRSEALYGSLPAPTGYLISLDYYDVYYAGDTVLLPDTVALRPDIAILPVRNSVTGLLEVEHAVEVVKQLQPRWVIPSHWQANGASSQLDVKTFEAAIGPLAQVVIPASV